MLQWGNVARTGLERNTHSGAGENMAASSILAVVVAAALAAAGTDENGVTPFETPADLTPQGKIDELVFARLRQLEIPPARLCSDAVFLRRVYLDAIGTLPTAAEARAFLADPGAGKRQVLIDRLLERDEFADYWAMKWSNLLRIKAEFPINLWPNAAQAYHRWIRASLKDNLPYEQFVRELLTANGSNFRVPQVNFYRAMQSREPQGIAQAVALTFMGARAEKWPKDRLAGMAGFFSRIGYKSTAEWKEEIVFFDPGKAAAQAVFPDGTPARLSPEQDPRAAFADWLIAPRNEWFARNIVNRIWAWLLGRGVIHEPDDIRPDNPAANPELLAYLQQELIGAHYDLKHVYRLILNSKTYQLSSIARGGKPEAAAQFAKYPLRRLEAEVLIDALCQVTGTTERYTSAIPEPYTFIPDDQRSIALPDGSITSSFLEQFGRPSRDTGLESERNNRLTADQRLHLLNSTHIRRKIEQSPNLQSLAQAATTQAELVREIYLTILSRFPTDEELKIIGVSDQPPKQSLKQPLKQSRKQPLKQPRKVKPRGVPTDLVWALLNSTEFLYRH
jgi:hypothetical protein